MANQVGHTASSALTTSGTTTKTMTVNNLNVGGITFVPFYFQNTGITWNSVSGNVNSWGAIVALVQGLGTVSPLSGYSMGVAYNVTTTTGSETLSLGFSSAPTGFQAISDQFKCNSNTIFQWDETGGGPYQTYNTTTGTAITLFEPSVQYAGIFNVMWGVTTTAFNAISGTGWNGNQFATQSMQDAYNTNYGPVGPQATANLSSTGFVYYLGCAFFCPALYIPQCTSELGVM